MSDHDLIERLAQRRRELRGDAELEQLTRGELSEPERAALEQRAEGDPALRAALDAHRPLDEAARERILARLVQRPEADRGDAPVERQRPRRARRLFGVWVLAPFALAAAVLLIVVIPRASEPSHALPRYALEVGGDAAMRGGGPEPIARLSPGSTLRIVARPSVAVPGSITARGVLVRGEEVVPLAGTWEASPSGALRLSARIEAPPGTWTLLVAVGRPDEVPEGAELAAAPLRDEDRRFQLLTAPVEVEPH